MNTQTVSSESIVSFIEDIFERRGSDSYLGEEVTMAQHMLQGAHLAEQDGADDELVAAALLHDIGHYTSEFPADMVGEGQDNFHQTAGAKLLESFFPQRVVDCVQHHVAAKRYLCTTDDHYYKQLSQASKDTLCLQGGLMNEAEVQAFTALPNLEAIVQVRRWDDQGKDPRRTTAPFSWYKPLLERLVGEHTHDA